MRESRFPDRPPPYWTKRQRSNKMPVAILLAFQSIDRFRHEIRSCRVDEKRFLQLVEFCRIEPVGMITLVRARLALSENDQLSGSLERNPPYDIKLGIPSANRSRVQIPEPCAFSKFIAQRIDLVPECCTPV